MSKKIVRYSLGFLLLVVQAPIYAYVFLFSYAVTPHLIIETEVKGAKKDNLVISFMCDNGYKNIFLYLDPTHRKAKVNQPIDCVTEHLKKVSFTFEPPTPKESATLLFNARRANGQWVHQYIAYWNLN